MLNSLFQTVETFLTHPLHFSRESLVRGATFSNTVSHQSILTDYELYAALTMSKAQGSVVFQIAGVCFDKSSSI